jgi:hypothetical protein
MCFYDVNIELFEDRLACLLCEPQWDTHALFHHACDLVLASVSQHLDWIAQVDAKSKAASKVARA